MPSKRLTSASSVTPQRSAVQQTEALPTGPFSGYVYEQASEPPAVLNECSPPDVPHAKPYYSIPEYNAYTYDFNNDERSTFLLLVAFSLQSDGL